MNQLNNINDKKIISLEITSDLKELLRVEAFKRNVTVSELIRQILTKELTNTVKK